MPSDREMFEAGWRRGYGTGSERERFEAGETDVFFHDGQRDKYLDSDPGGGRSENPRGLFLVFAEYEPEAGCKIYGLFTSLLRAEKARVLGDESREAGEPLAAAVILPLTSDEFRAGWDF